MDEVVRRRRANWHKSSPGQRQIAGVITEGMIIRGETEWRRRRNGQRRRRGRYELRKAWQEEETNERRWNFKGREEKGLRVAM